MNNRQLRKEIRKLQRENEYLKHRLTLHGENVKGKKEKKNPFSQMLMLANASEKKTYFGYLLGRLQGSFLFRMWDRTRFAVRVFFVASKLWKFMLFLFFVLGLSTQVFLFIGALAFLLPAMLILSLLFFGTGYFVYRKWNRKFDAYLQKNPACFVYLIFWGKRMKNSPYLQKRLSEYEKNGIVFFVVPRLRLSSFAFLTKIGDRRYCMHISYYFVLRRILPSEKTIKFV